MVKLERFVQNHTNGVLGLNNQYQLRAAMTGLLDLSETENDSKERCSFQTETWETRLEDGKERRYGADDSNRTVYIERNYCQ